MSDENSEMTLAILTYIIGETQASLRSARRSIIRAEMTWTGLESIVARSMMTALSNIKRDISAAEAKLAGMERELNEMKEDMRKGDA